MPHKNSQRLFESVTMKNVTLKNRIVMAPMTRQFSPAGVPTDEVAEYYKKRALGEVGLIITEGTVIQRISSSNEKDIPHIYGEKALAGWQKVVEEVHAAGGKIAAQIWHMGVVPYAKNWQPSAAMEGPSGLLVPGKKTGNEMSEADIQDTIKAFAEAALNAKTVGFDAIEIHAAHGYLIDQFFWPEMNLRTDQWGGNTIEKRNRFAVEIIKAIRIAVGDDYPIIIRLSQWKQQDYEARIAHNPEELKQWVLPLSEAGVDIFHCSQRRFWEPEFEGSDLNFAGWVKKITQKPTITVGSVGLSSVFLNAFKGEGSEPSSIDQLIERLENNEFDLVAVGRSLLGDPQWAMKIKENNYDALRGFTKEDLMALK